MPKKGEFPINKKSLGLIHNWQLLIAHELRGWGKVEIRTDSTYAIKAITEYAPIWRSNADENGNWYNSKGKMVNFKTVIEIVF